VQIILLTYTYRSMRLTESCLCQTVSNSPVQCVTVWPSTLLQN